MFQKSVVHITQHTADSGAIGIVLNKPAHKKVGDFLKGEEFEKLSNLPVFYGGPVATEHLSFSAYWWTPDHQLAYSIRISAEEASEFMSKSGAVVKAYLGYSGWSKSQLEAELDQQAWFIAPTSQRLLNAVCDESLWKVLMQDLSPYHKVISDSPDKPSLN